MATAAAVAVMVGSAVRLRADPPTTAAAVPPPDLTHVRGGGHGPRHGGAITARPGPPTASDREQAMQFLREHAPESYKVITALPAPARDVQEAAVAVAYLKYEQVRTNGSDGLYEAIVKRVEADDAVYGLRLQYRRSTGKARDALLPQLRAAVTTQTDASLKERELRLARLERATRRERERLAADNAHKDKLVNDRLNAITADADEAAPVGNGER